MANPAIIGVRPTATPSERNRGNFIHAAAARRLIGGGKEFQHARPWDEAQIEGVRRHSHLVVIMANAIRLGVKSSDVSALHDTMANNIERAGLPTVVFGLGAQASLDSGSKGEMPPETRRLMQVLSAHSQAIAVRGGFTAEALGHIGVKNAEVIGCQSTFWHGAAFPHELKVGGSPQRVMFNYTNPRPEARFVSWNVKLGHEAVSQAENWEESVMRGEDPVVPRKLEEVFINTSLSLPEYRKFCRSKFHAYDNVEDWMTALKDFTFSIGSRFHGNMTAMQAGVPALWVVHDSRTRELCETLALPSITLNEALEDLRIERFLERADYGPFHARYAELYTRFRDYVRRAGLNVVH